MCVGDAQAQLSEKVGKKIFFFFECLGFRERRGFRSCSRRERRPCLFCKNFWKTGLLFWRNIISTCEVKIQFYWLINSLENLKTHSLKWKYQFFALPYTIWNFLYQRNFRMWLTWNKKEYKLIISVYDKKITIINITKSVLKYTLVSYCMFHITLC